MIQRNRMLNQICNTSLWADARMLRWYPSSDTADALDKHMFAGGIEDLLIIKDT